MLCRSFDDDGFVLYTNQESRKAHELEYNPRAALVFGWIELARQVRIEGPVTLVDDATADAYWASRPRGSQIGAWASAQSEAVDDRDQLDRQQAEVEQRFGADPAATADPAPAGLGRLPGRHRADGVLAGPAQPPARPLRVPPHRAPAGPSPASPPDPPLRNFVVDRALRGGQVGRRRCCDRVRWCGRVVRRGRGAGAGRGRGAGAAQEGDQDHGGHHQGEDEGSFERVEAVEPARRRRSTSR